MNKLLIDTNIVLDLLARRHPFYTGAAEIFSYADKNILNLSISSLTIANINYVLTRLKSASEAREILRRFKEIGIRQAKVSTNNHPFFIPAQRMYTACGFREVNRIPWDRDISQNMIHYELDLDNIRFE